jgi:hypothetical protein
MNRNSLYDRYFRLSETANIKAVVKDLEMVLNSNNNNIKVPNTLLANISTALADPKVASALKNAGLNTQAVQKEVQNVVKNFGGNVPSNQATGGRGTATPTTTTNNGTQQNTNASNGGTQATDSNTVADGAQGTNETPTQQTANETPATNGDQKTSTPQVANEVPQVAGQEEPTVSVDETQLKIAQNYIGNMIKNAKKNNVNLSKDVLLAAVNKMTESYSLKEYRAWELINTSISEELNKDLWETRKPYS